MPDTPEQSPESHTHLRELVEEERRAEAAERGRERASTLRGRVNSAYWQLLFDRLAALGGREGAALEFTDADRLLFDFGVIDDRAFADDYDGREYEILFLSEWLVREDNNFLEVVQRNRTQTELDGVRAGLEAVEKEVRALRKKRRAAAPAPTAEAYEAYEKALFTVHCLEFVKKRKGMAPDEVKRYAEEMRVAEKVPGLVVRDAAAREELDRLSGRVLALLKKGYGFECRRRELADAQTKEFTQYESALIQRRQNLDDRLRLMRQFGQMCARLSKSSPYPLLAPGRRPHQKADFVETLRVIEEFDETLFRNRRVLRFGRPRLLLIPGSGNGTYDFTTNTLVLPLNTPHSLFESVAYAIAYYRKDIDQQEKQGLWESFFDDAVWARATPCCPRRCASGSRSTSRRTSGGPSCPGGSGT